MSDLWLPRKDFTVDKDIHRANARAIESYASKRTSQVYRVLDRSTDDSTVGNTTARTPLYSYTFDPADLSLTSSVRLQIGGQYIQNSGVDQTLALSLNYADGGDYSTGARTFASSSGNRKWALDALLMHNGSTVEIVARAMVSEISAFALQPVAGNAVFVGSWSVSADRSTSNTLTVEATHGVANANVTITKHTAILEQF